MPHVYTYATHKEGFFNSLMDSCDKVGITPVVKGMGHEWKGFVERHRELLKFMETLGDDDIIVNIDGFDTIVLCPLDEIIRRFTSMGCEALFSMTADNGGIGNKYIQWKLGFSGTKANAGMFMGYVSKLREIIGTLLKSNHSDDQMVINTFIHEDPDIKIDTERMIFCNITTLKYTDVIDGTFYYGDKQPCLLSAPGCVNINPILEQLGIQTSMYTCNAMGRIKGYYKYFIIEIIVVLFLIYMLLRNMKKVQRRRVA
jgi:hypothetical protein